MKNAFLAVLAVLVALLGNMAWRQHRQIDALEQSAVRDALEYASLRQRIAESAPGPASAEQPRADAPAVSPGAPIPPVADTNLRTEPARPPANSAPPIDNPAVQKVMAVGIKSTLDQRYGSLFRQIKLSPSELDKFKDLLAERQMSGLDVVRAVQIQGMDTGNLPALVEKVQSEVDESIRRLIGEQRFQQYQHFNQNAGSYALLEQIERRLSYTNTPLLESQSGALLRLLADTTQGPSGEGGPGRVAQGFDGATPFAAAAPRAVTDDTLGRAGEVLTPAQAEILQQLQAEQQAHAKLRKAIRTNPNAMATPPDSSAVPVALPPPR